MDMNIDRDLLKKLRIDKSWSQEQLADEAGLSLRTVQRIENEGIASLQSRKVLAEALGISPSYLDVQTVSTAEESSEVIQPVEEPHFFTPSSIMGYYILNSFRLFSLGFLWLCLASNAFFGASVLIGSVFFWELTPFKFLESLGAGILSIVFLVVPGHFVFYWLYRHAKRMVVQRPISEDAVNYSNN